jgi:hypothetical protein
MSNIRTRIDALVAIVACSMESGPWIAGGAVRALLTNEDCDDIDLFFASQEQADAAEAALVEAGARRMEHGEVFPSSNPHPPEDALPEAFRSVYFDVPNVGHVNVARTHVWRDVGQLLESFDFTVCMAASAGGDLRVARTFLADLGANRLVPHRETTAYRVIKYLKKGYTLAPELAAAWEARGGGPVPGLVAPAGKGRVENMAPLPEAA